MIPVQSVMMANEFSRIAEEYLFVEASMSLEATYGQNFHAHTAAAQVLGKAAPKNAYERREVRRLFGNVAASALHESNVATNRVWLQVESEN